MTRRQNQNNRQKPLCVRIDKELLANEQVHTNKSHHISNHHTIMYHPLITSYLKPPHYYVPPSHHIISQTTTLSRTTLSSHHISNHHTIMYHPLITSHLKPPHYHINTSIEYTLTPLFNTPSILYSSSIGGVRVTDQVHPLKPQWSQLVVRVLSMRSFRGGNSKTSYSIWALQWRVWYVYLLTHTRIHLPTHL